MHTKTTICSM